MPSTALALTPGLASFLKSLKTNPLDTSIDNLISCALNTARNIRLILILLLGCSSEDKFDILGHARLPLLISSSVSFLLAERQTRPS